MIYREDCIKMLARLHSIKPTLDFSPAGAEHWCSIDTSGAVSRWTGWGLDPWALFPYVGCSCIFTGLVWGRWGVHGEEPRRPQPHGSWLRWGCCCSRVFQSQASRTRGCGGESPPRSVWIKQEDVREVQLWQRLCGGATGDKHLFPFVSVLLVNLFSSAQSTGSRWSPSLWLWQRRAQAASPIRDGLCFTCACCRAGFSCDVERRGEEAPAPPKMGRSSQSLSGFGV